MADPSLIELEGLLGSLGLETPVPEFKDADVLTRPIDIYRSYLASYLSQSGVVHADPKTVYDAIHSSTDITLGDLAVILPRLRLNEDEMKHLPLELKFKLPDSPLFPAPFLDGVYLRFIFSPKTLPRLLLSYISDRGAAYGSEPGQGLVDPSAPATSARRRAVVEFSSPNMASEFSDEHLRSTFLGAVVANLYEAMGWEVVRLNYLGDWGKQIGLLAVGWDRFGSEEALAAEPVRHLQDVYARIREAFRPEEEARDRAKKKKQGEEGPSAADIEARGIFAERDAFFKRMEDGDGDALALWARFREVTVADLSAAYDRLGIRFDEYAGESRVKPETMAEVEAALKESGALEESEGSWIIDFEKASGRRGLGTVVLRRRNGSTSYLLRDIAAVLDRERDFAFDRMLYVVTARQDSHFERLFAALDLMGRGDLRKRLDHVAFGRITGLERHTQAHLLGGLLDDTAALMREARAREEGGEGEDGAAAAPAEGGHANGEAADISDMAAISALLAQDMGGKRTHASTFDPKRMTTFDADSGLKLQMWYASLVNTIESMRVSLPDEVADAVDVDFGALDGEEIIDLLRVMAQYPDATLSAFKYLEPHTVLQYLYRLVYAIGVCLDNGEDGEDDGEEIGESSAMGAARALEYSPGAQKAKLLLYRSARQVLENGMKLLGFPLVAH